MRSGAFEPIQIPAGFWDRSDTRQALQARDIGMLFRLVRRHTGASQTRIGVAVGIPQGKISEITRGKRHVESMDVLERIADGLGMVGQARMALGLAAGKITHPYPSGVLVPHREPGDQQRGGVGAGPATVACSALVTSDDGDPWSWWAHADTVEITSEFTRRDLMLDRRETARMVAGVVVGGALLEPLERWLSSATEESYIGRPGSVGRQEVERIENAAQVFRDWDDRWGGGLRRKAVIGQLNEVADLLRESHSAEMRRRLFGAVAQLSETSATMSWDSGYQALAQRYYMLSLRASKAAGDRLFGAYVLAAMARQLLYLDRPADALELVRIAQDTVAGDNTGSIRSMLHTREAWAYAELGRISAFQRATGKAEDALGEAKSAEDPYWIAYFDVAELEGTTGGRLLGLARHDKRFAEAAAERISRAIDLRRPGRLRSSALDEIGMAELRLVQGETEEASRLGHRAAKLVERTTSDRVRVKLAELYRHSNVYADTPVVAGLRERIRPLCVVRPT